jgi:hypothetical protein
MMRPADRVGALAHLPMDAYVRQRPDFGAAPCANALVDVLRPLQQPAWAPGLEDSISSSLSPAATLSCHPSSHLFH